ncbi:nucleoside triphosphate pyrophosphohydrolase ham1 [Ceratobasidium sp. UAMH 11750]|nr:nucleoside triphosphate pyrophosphohydrolase ham1 [Ceratobasidium sp. UAMH 11750]
MPDGTLTFVTGNANKLREVQEILAGGTVPLVIESRNIDLPEIQGTPAEVSREKCRRAAEIVGGPCITEDTSLGFVALNGLPGAYIKWFLSAVGTEGESRACLVSSSSLAAVGIIAGHAVDGRGRGDDVGTE